MKRKNFIAACSISGLSFMPFHSTLSTVVSNFDEKNLKNNKLIVKVKQAMLSMQRATWEQGVAMQAMLELGEEDIVILMAKEAVLRQSKDGRLAMLGEEIALTDAASPGEALLWAAKKTNDPVLMNGFNKMVDYIMNKAPRDNNGIIYHFTNVPQIWSDSLYMLPPFLAAAGEFKEAVKQIEGILNCLWNTDKKLLSHMWDSEKKEFVRKAFWGVGNGWSAAGITRVINALPSSMENEKTKLISYTKDIIDGCLKYMRGDGLFHNIVDDPSSFVETNLSQQLAYSIYKGIKGGWLNNSYRSGADKMRGAAHAKVDKLGLVQGVCGSPEFDHPGTATEGQVFFILMEVAHSELV